MKDIPPIDNPYEKPSVRNYALGILTLVYTFNFVDRQLLSILQEAIKAELLLSDAQLGLLTGFAFAMFYVTAGVPIARYADRSNRRNIVAASVGLWSFMTAIIGFVQNYTQLLPARIGVGIGSSAWPEELQRVVSEPLYWAWLPALEKTADMIGFTVNSLVKMVQGLISTSNLSGPITIAKIANQTAQTSLESFVTFIALVSISLGVLNLLPIPMLDGGHLFYFFIEAVTRRPVPERVQLWGLQVGMVLLVGIMMLAFYNDLLRL